MYVRKIVAFADDVTFLHKYSQVSSEEKAGEYKWILRRNENRYKRAIIYLSAHLNKIIYDNYACKTNVSRINFNKYKKETQWLLVAN